MPPIITRFYLAELLNDVEGGISGTRRDDEALAILAGSPHAAQARRLVYLAEGPRSRVRNVAGVMTVLKYRAERRGDCKESGAEPGKFPRLGPFDKRD